MRALGKGSLAALVVVVGLSLAGCSDGSDGANGTPGPAGPPGPGGDPGPSPGPAPIEVGASDPLPGVAIDVISVSGGSGVGGNFLPGDSLRIDFNVAADDGTPLPFDTLDRSEFYVSGPTTNYNRVLPAASMSGGLVVNEDGSWTYTSAPLPVAYTAPYNDTGAFGIADGELTGQSLQDGTYTWGFTLRWPYEVGGVAYRDAGIAVGDFLFGSAVALQAREVVSPDACNQCHGELRAHGNNRIGAKSCMLCHTAGAEDRNTPGVAGGTPGASIDWKVMVHKIHNGSHLPSVLGVSTNGDGTRNYAVTPVPYGLMGYGDEVHDYSDVGFPVNPSAYVAYLYDSAGTTYTGTGGNGPMPRDAGYGALPGANKLQDDRMRTGVVACGKCHDGAAQGEDHRSKPTRRACGSCHDDIDWALPYTANGTTMPANPTDASCATCHPASGGPLAVADAHLHPYLDPAFNTGIHVVVTAVGGGTGTGGKHQAGDPITATFTVRNSAGADVNVHSTTRFQGIAIGPNENPQILGPNVTLFDTTAWRKSSPFTGNGTITGTSIGAGATRQVLCVAFTGTNVYDVIGSSSGAIATGQVLSQGGAAPITAGGVSFTLNDGSTDFAAGDRWYLEVWPTASSYTVSLANDYVFERVGTATGGADVFSVANLPLWWGRHTVFERTALVAGVATLEEPAQNFAHHVVVDSSLFSALAAGDRIVIDAGTPEEEYVQIGWIQTTDAGTGNDLGTRDRVWFLTGLRFYHAAGTTVQEATLSTRREGTQYAVLGVDGTGRSATGQIQAVAGKFTSGNPVVVSYRGDLRFGWRRYSGDTLQAVYQDPMQDSDDIGQEWGDWKGLPIVDGSYRVGFYVNRDYSVTAAGGEATSYRMISPPAVKDFLYGTATETAAPWAIADGSRCDRCHGEVTFHGNGRSGLDTCLLCHRISGVEDGPKYRFASWYTGYTEGAAMEFRTMVHKIHMGKEMPKASEYEMIGIFLGIPYKQKVEHFGYPQMPGGTSQCESCHGNDAWKAPRDRNYPGPASVTPTRTWAAVCNACHDSDAARAHAGSQTSLSGAESCAICHGSGRDADVEKVHLPRPR